MGFNAPLGKITKVWNSSAIVRKEAASSQFSSAKAASVLQRLKIEEANLIEEKQILVSLKEKQRLTLQKEVRSKNEVIEKLRAEITDLKVECEKLSISIRASRNVLNQERASKRKIRQTLKNKGYSEKAINEIWKWYDYIANSPVRN